MVSDGFGWFQVVSDGFWWFAVLVVTVFETFVEVADDLTMSYRSYLALKERAK